MVVCCLTFLKVHLRCFNDLARAREALRQCLPDLLRDQNFTACLKDDVTTVRWLAQLLMNVGFAMDNVGVGHQALPSQ